MWIKRQNSQPRSGCESEKEKGEEEPFTDTVFLCFYIVSRDSNLTLFIKFSIGNS